MLDDRPPCCWHLVENIGWQNPTPPPLLTPSGKYWMTEPDPPLLTPSGKCWMTDPPAADTWWKILDDRTRPPPPLLTPSGKCWMTDPLPMLLTDPPPRPQCIIGTTAVRSLQSRWNFNCPLIFKCFWWTHTCVLFGANGTLLWISGDVSSGVQSQSGFCLICLCRGKYNVDYTFPEIHLWCYTCQPLDSQHVGWSLPHMASVVNFMLLKKIEITNISCTYKVPQ